MKKSESTNVGFFQANIALNKQGSNSHFRKRILHNNIYSSKQQNFPNIKITEEHGKRKKSIIESRYQLIDESYNKYLELNNSNLDFHLKSPLSNRELNINNTFSSPRNLGKLNYKLPTESSIPKLSRFSTVNSIQRIGSFQDFDDNIFNNTSTTSDDKSNLKGMLNSRMDSSPAIFMQEEGEFSNNKIRLPPLQLNPRSSTMSILPNIPESEEIRGCFHSDKGYITTDLKSEKELENMKKSQNTIKSLNFRIVTSKETQTKSNKFNESKLKFERNMKGNLSPSPNSLNSNRDDAKNISASKVNTEKIEMVTQANSVVNQYLLKHGLQSTKKKPVHLKIKQDLQSLQDIIRDKISPRNYTPVLPVKKEFKLGKGSETAGFVNHSINQN